MAMGVPSDPNNSMALFFTIIQLGNVRLAYHVNEVIEMGTRNLVRFLLSGETRIEA